MVISVSKNLVLFTNVALQNIHLNYNNLNFSFIIVALQGIFSFISASIIASTTFSIATTIVIFVLTFFAVFSEIIYWFVITGIFHYSAKLLGGNGRFKGLMILTGFSKTPILLTSLIMLCLSITLRGNLSASMFLIVMLSSSLVGRIWESLLSIFSVSINHQIRKHASSICVFNSTGYFFNHCLHISI
ncbi:MAG: YIP1 family protein [Candidatus Bathyarchaeia archaeon]